MAVSVPTSATSSLQGLHDLLPPPQGARPGYPKPFSKILNDIDENKMMDTVQEEGKRRASGV